MQSKKTGFSGEKDRCGSCCCEKKCKDQQKSGAAGSEKEETVRQATAAD